MWGGPSGHLTWPLNPPKETKTNKKNKKKEKTKKQKKNTKNTKKSFSVISQIFPFCWVSKISFFETLAQKARQPKTTIKIGVSARFFLENGCASRNGHFWTKHPKTRNSSYHFLPFSSLSTTKKHKTLLKPYLIVF